MNPAPFSWESKTATPYHQEGCEQHLVLLSVWARKKGNGQIHAVKTVPGLWSAMQFSDYDR